MARRKIVVSIVLVLFSAGLLAGAYSVRKLFRKRQAPAAFETKDRRKPRAPVILDAKDVRAVAFSPDGRMLASGGTDNTIKLWDVAGAR